MTCKNTDLEETLLDLMTILVEWNRGIIDKFSAKVVNRLKVSGMAYESVRTVKPPGSKKFTGQNIEF